MPSITVYGSRMGSSFRVHWMLAELALPYDTKEVNLSAGEQRSPEFLALNPAGQIPVITIDDFVLSESMAISRYLAARFKPELNGRSQEEQAKGMQWELWTMINVQKHLHTLALPAWTGMSDEAAETKAREALAKLLPILEGRLAASAFIAGDSFTTADINVACTLAYAEYSHYGLTAYPNLTKWLENVRSREAYQLAKNAPQTATA